jgi:hypothetical protein
MVIANIGRGGTGSNYAADYMDDKGKVHSALLFNHDRSLEVLDLLRKISEVMLLESNEIPEVYQAMFRRFKKKNKFRKKKAKEVMNYGP